MKKYTIQFNFDAVASVDVLANSEEEARSKAREVELELSDYDLQVVYESVESETEVPDLTEMIEKAGLIIRLYDERQNDEPFAVDTYPKITTQLWNGEDYVNKHYLVEDFYWDSDREELGMIIDEDVEIMMSELSEMEQFNVSKLIIESATINDIKL